MVFAHALPGVGVTEMMPRCAQLRSQLGRKGETEAASFKLARLLASTAVAPSAAVGGLCALGLIPFYFVFDSFTI